MLKINLITNEELFFYENKYYCNNIEIKNLTDELDNISFTSLIGKKSKKKKFQKINNKKIFGSKNIISFLSNILDQTKIENSVFLVVSITPFTFLSILILKLLRQKYLIYLRSDGLKEYKKIIGFLGPPIYKLLFKISIKNSKVISSSKEILKTIEGESVIPSSLSAKWDLNKKKFNFYKIKMLYVGRLRVEKGIFSLIKIFEKINKDMQLTIIGNDDRAYKKPQLKNINFKGIISDENELIKNYDNHNIFILPSFTESYSMVIDEALSRLRPVIIFEEIKDIIGERKGIFVCKRDEKDLLSKINYIAMNYENILREIKKNEFINKKQFAKTVYQKLNDL